MVVAVTGASGHIGNCLVRELLNQGNRVKALIHHFRNDLDTMDVEIVQGDLLDNSALEELCRDVDVVFHLAARITIDNRNSDLTKLVNIKGTENILKASMDAGVKRLIHFSSIHAHHVQPIDKELDENRPLIDSDKIVYEFTKAEGERLVYKYVKEGLDAVIINPTAVIGPFDYYNSYLGQVFRMIYNNKLPMLINGGYNWVDVRDVVSGTISAVEKGRKGEKYLLSGHYCTIPELSKWVGKVAAKKTPTLVVPDLLARIACPFIGFYSLLTKSDPLYTRQSLEILANCPERISYQKAQKELDYYPRTLEQTITDTLKWYKENGLIN